MQQTFAETTSVLWFFFLKAKINSNKT